MTNSSNRFYGVVGFVEAVEESPGIWNPAVVAERPYHGYVDKNFRRSNPGEGLIDDVVIDNVVRLVTDTYAMQHYPFIKYVVLNGFKWTVTSVEVAHPELKLYLGALYNGVE